MGLEIFFRKSAEAQFGALDKPIREQVWNKLLHLKENPRIGEPLSNILAGNWRLHVGRCRIIYRVEGNEIVIMKIGPRKTSYTWRK